MHYSEAALYNKFYRGGWIELCNNDCGKLVYKDVDTGEVKNATGTDSDVLHKDTCSVIANLKEFARSINWYPNLSIDPVLDSLFGAFDQAKKDYDYSGLMYVVNELRDVINNQKMKNKEAKVKWDEKKRKKLQTKQLQDEYAARQVDQQSQYDVLIKNADFRKRWYIDPWPIE